MKVFSSWVTVISLCCLILLFCPLLHISIIHLCTVLFVLRAALLPVDMIVLHLILPPFVHDFAHNRMSFICRKPRCWICDFSSATWTLKMWILRYADWGMPYAVADACCCLSDRCLHCKLAWSSCGWSLDAHPNGRKFSISYLTTWSEWSHGLSIGLSAWIEQHLSNLLCFHMLAITVTGVLSMGSPQLGKIMSCCILLS